MINALYLSFHGYSEYNGISKKKLAQIKGLRECGCNVVNCYYSIDPINGHSVWMTDENVLADLGKGIRAKIKKRIDYTPILNYIQEREVSLVYMRSEHNASPFLISFVRQLKKRGVKTVMEIPTYPYDQEYVLWEMRLGLSIDKIFRKHLAMQLIAVVTFSNYSEIFGQRTVRISNGIDFSSIKLKQKNHTQSELHLIGVAEIHYWHGFDRVVAGLRDYYKMNNNNYRVFFHIVGEFSGEREKNEILPLIRDNGLEEYVILHGRLFGEDLDKMFDKGDFAIGSLGRHRSGIINIKTLKNREYAARGIPFIYSEIDDDFEEMPFIMKAPADESPIEINQIIDFYNRSTNTSEEIRNSVQDLSWKNQMQKVLNIVENKK